MTIVTAALAFGTALGAAEVARATACSNPGYDTLRTNGHNKTWSGGHYGYTTEADSMPNGTDARAMVVRGHNAWDKTVNDCGYGDQNNVTTRWESDCPTATCGKVTDAPAANLVGFSDACYAAGCTWTHSTNTGAIFSADTAFNPRLFWWTYSGNTPPGYYDLKAAAVHETGHALGLADLYSQTELTMYYQMDGGESKKRTLGRGDIRGMRFLYPSSQPRNGALYGDRFCQADGCVLGSNNPLNGDTDAVNVDSSETQDAVGGGGSDT